MVDSLYYSCRKIPERCENYFVDYRINYQQLCYWWGKSQKIWTQPLYMLLTLLKVMLFIPYRDILLAYIEGVLSHTDSQFLYTDMKTLKVD